MVSELLWEKGKTACLVFNITIATGPFSNQSLFSSISRIFQMNVGNCKDSQQRGGKFNHNNRAYSVQLLLSDTQVHSLEQTTLSLDLRSCSTTLTISIAYLLHYVILRTVVQYTNLTLKFQSGFLSTGYRFYVKIDRLLY